MALPSNISTGRVVGQFIVGVVDGDDLDDDPDFIPAQGQIIFSSPVPYLPNRTAEPNPVTMLTTPITGVLDAEGYLCTPLASDPSKPGKRGLRLVATDDSDAGVEGWTWTATPRFEDVNGTVLGAVIPQFSFVLPSNGEIDLTSVVKVPSSPGIGQEHAFQLLAQAEAAAVVASLAAKKAAEDAAEVTRRANAGEFKGDKGDANKLTVGTVTKAVTPEVTITGTAPNQTVNFKLPQGDTGLTPNIKIGTVETVSNPADGSWVAGLIRGSADVTGALRDSFPSTMKGEKGDVGTGFTPVNLSNRDLNTVIVHGMYFQGGDNAIASLNYPAMKNDAGSTRGILEVTTWGNTPDSIMQIYRTKGRLGYTPSLEFRRVLHTTTGWSAWQMTPYQRVDNTAGKAIYTWDDTQNREQLIYGDTGWRSIGQLIPTWVKGHVLFRRTTHLAEFLFEAAEFTDEANVAIPIPISNSHAMLTGHSPIPSAALGLGAHRFEWNWDGNHKIVKTNNSGLRGYISFPCRAAWPTTLPGTAFGA